MRLVSSLVNPFEQSVANLPMREAVRYTTKNMKWSAGDLNRQANNQANALLEHGFTPGDTVAIWLNESAEKVNKYMGYV